MSTSSLGSGARHKREQGTARSYVIGFLLSLVFTFIPYYLVVNQTITGTLLLVAIIVIAVLQMLIQIFFFLHLGRGPKPLYNIAFFGATVITILVVVGGSIWIMSHLNYNMTSIGVTKYLAEKEGISQVGGEKTGACKGQYANHKITTKNGQVNPVHTVAKKCDTLTFINEDDTARELTFGIHPQHDSYAGNDELTVRKGRNKTITLSEIGWYQFHDHLQPKTAGDFTVAP